MKLLALDEILKMNLKELRTLDGRRATDDAIKNLVTHFNNFFSANSLDRVTDIELLQFKEKIQAITNLINEVEYHFALNKYQKDQKLPESDAKRMAIDSMISYEKIPQRMQFWAAGPRFGDNIRNPAEHIEAVASLNKWFMRLEQLVEKEKLEKPQASTNRRPG